jgi:hypothetical protein
MSDPIATIRQARETYGRRVVKARRALMEAPEHNDKDLRIVLATSVINETVNFLAVLDDVLYADEP